MAKIACKKCGAKLTKEDIKNLDAEDLENIQCFTCATDEIWEAFERIIKD